MNMKKCISLIMAAVMTVGLLGGCKSEMNPSGTNTGEEKANTDTAKPVAMGRYIEKSIKLPEFSEEEKIVTILNTDSRYLLFSSKQSDHTFYEYTLQEDGEWEKKAAEWLNGTVGAEKKSVSSIISGRDGNIYAFYFGAGYKPKIIKCDGNQGKEVSVAGFDVKNELPNAVLVEENGNLIVSYAGGNLVLYDAENGDEIRRFEQAGWDTDNITGSIDVYQNKLLTVSKDFNSFLIYDIETGNLLNEIPCPSLMNEGEKVRFDQNGGFYFLNDKGLHHFQSEGSIMETVIDGALNTIGIPGIVKLKLLIEGEEYFVLYKDDDSYELVKYQYDPNVATIPATQLTLYGLRENSAVSRAIGAFQKEYPDIQIVYTVAESEEGAVTEADNIRTLNTELLSGKGADILLLDGLPVESYIEKGVLCDLSDVILPMTEKGELLENIVSCYKNEEGKFYGVPARFSVPLFYGEQDAIEAMMSFEAMKNYTKPENGRIFIGYPFITTSYKQAAKLLLNISYRELVGSDNRFSKDKLLEYLNMTKSFSDMIGAKKQMEAIAPYTQSEALDFQKFKENDKNGFEIGAMPTESELVSTEIKGLMDMMEPTTFLSDFGKSYSTVNELFIPNGIIGINQASEQKEAAKNFIKLLLSEESQSKDLNSGFPINSRALEKWSSKRSETMMAAGFSGENPSEIISFDYPTEQEINSFIEEIEKLAVPLNIDKVFQEMIINETEQFLEGSISAEKAAEAILSKANTYFAE